MLINKKRNKKAIIITAVAMLAGILFILAGIFGGSVAGMFKDNFDFRDLKPEDIGKTINMDMKVYYENIDVPNKTMQTLGDLSGDWYSITLDLSDLSLDEQRLYYSKTSQYVTVQGTIRELDEAEFTEVKEGLYKLYDYIYYEKERKITLDEFHDILTETVLPYCIDVRSVSSFNWIPFIPTGIFIFLISLVLEVCFVFKLKKRIVLPVVYGLMVIVPAILFAGHIRTMLTVKKVTDGLYTMDNLECLDTQKMLDSDSGTINGMLDWIFANHFYGAPNVFTIDRNHLGFGCAAFSAETPEGDHLMGRNFDLLETDTLLVHSHPEGAYESIGVADLGIFSVGQTYPISPDSPLGKLIMVITPYVVLDGMNEKGVAAGILELNIEETHQDKGKPDLLIFCAIRGILDNCASVDEALALLESYDIHSDLEVNYHLFITDKTGRYVVVEWLDGEMVVVEHPCCTNSVIAAGEYFDKGSPDDRIKTIEKELGPDRIVTEDKAMEILDMVHSKHGITEWSCVYNLNDFTVNICLDADYSKVYSFSASELR
ncbi:MAG: linear amide C-N hydrolase [Clostridiales bacterium]|nr:linear amide C-N hydrolase [Clostridiales bacterium]